MDQVSKIQRIEHAIVHSGETEGETMQATVHREHIADGLA